MKNSDLIKISQEVVNSIFDPEKYLITISPIPYNGAHICVKEIVNSPYRKYTEYYQVGFNCKVYAISGKENIIRKIKKSYCV